VAESGCSPGTVAGTAGLQGYAPVASSLFSPERGTCQHFGLSSQEPILSYHLTAAKSTTRRNSGPSSPKFATGPSSTVSAFLPAPESACTEPRRNLVARTRGLRLELRLFAPDHRLLVFTTPSETGLTVTGGRPPFIVCSDRNGRGCDFHVQGFRVRR